MTTPPEPLVGRDDEVQRLERVLDEIGTKSSRFVAVSGEPGIGKTRLLEELARLAEDRGHLVLEGRAAQLEGELPFGPLIDACDEYLASVDGRRIDRLGPDALAELATIFPALARGSEGRPSALVDERYRAHRAVGELLGRLALPAPVVLVLDDMHWADQASVELVAHLVRRAPPAPLLLAVAWRSGQAPPRISDALRSDRGRHARAIELRALGAGEAERLMPELDDAARQALFEESGGNPFYLEELVRTAPRARTLAAPLGADVLGVPPAVAAAIAVELEALSLPARAFIQGAAVAGDPFELDLGAAAAGVGDDAALDALDELVERGLARSTGVPRRFRFRHPLVRAAVYESSPPGFRLRGHERASAALASRGSSPAARAHHVAVCARAGDRDAIALLYEAATAAAPRAPGTAARWLRAALELLPEGGDAQLERLAMLGALGGSLAAAGRLAESRDVLVDALDALPAGSGDAQLGLITACAEVEILLGWIESARRRLLRALDLVTADSGDERRLQLMLAIVAYYAGEPDAMADHAARVARADVAGGARAAHSHGLMALARTQAGPLAEAHAELAAGVAVAERLSDEELAQAPDAFINLGASALFVERHGLAVPLLRRGLNVCRVTNRGQFIALLSTLCAGAEAVRGDLDAAFVLLDDAEDAARLTANPLGLTWTLYWRSRTELLRGDLDRAMAAAEEGMEVARTLEGTTMRGWVTVALADALVETGRAEEAIALVIEHAGGSDLAQIGVAHRTGAYALLARAALALRHDDDAADWAERAGRAAHVDELPVSACIAALALASVRLARGDHAAAAATALDASRIAERAGAPIEAGRARLLAGRALAAAGDRERALPELAAAESQLAECGAERDRNEATRELRRLGRRSGASAGRRPAADTAGLAGLSGREGEVADLVADRQTNGEIAAALFISEKTVETHLRNIFRKLDASSRREVGRTVEAERRAKQP
jgi:ATP/maltotriose-dependent transcriptional regulator MalT